VQVAAVKSKGDRQSTLNASDCCQSFLATQPSGPPSSGSAPLEDGGALLAGAPPPGLKLGGRLGNGGPRLIGAAPRHRGNGLARGRVEHLIWCGKGFAGVSSSGGRW
jgi:hypothetical protein